jgi:hypothetical protein
MTKVSYKKGRSAQVEIETKPKHSKEREYGLNQISTSTRYTALLRENSEGQQHRTCPENTPNLLQFI